MRQAPAEGYDANPRKRHYRKQVWSTLRRHLAGSGIRQAQVALMPSSEGSEIENALRAGFQESNLHVIDRNPAIVAHLKRRYPRINTYGVELMRAFEVMRLRGIRLSGANLDLCGPVGIPTLVSLSRSADRNRAKSAVVCVNVLRGREQHDWSDAVDTLGQAFECNWARRCAGDLSDLTGSDRARAAFPWWAFSGFDPASKLHMRDYHARLLRHEIYRSNAGHQTFLWTAWRLDKWPCLALIPEEYADRYPIDGSVYTKAIRDSVVVLRVLEDIQGEVEQLINQRVA